LLSGSTLGELPHTTRGDFVFGGWWNSPNGGTPTPPNRIVPNGQQIGKLPTVTRSNYTFAGWWTSQSCEVPLKFAKIKDNLYFGKVSQYLPILLPCLVVTSINSLSKIMLKNSPVKGSKFSR